jgi:hypothetical protein
MKKHILHLLPLLVFFNSCSQPIEVSEKSSQVILNAFQSAINARDFSIVEPLLAPNYQYMTMTGTMAKEVLRQVVTQYPKIDSISVISTLKKGNETTLSVIIYNVNESSNRKISLDKDNNILRADIAEISMQRHGSATKDEQPETNSIRGKDKLVYTFRLSEIEFIVVEASINGITGNFIVDSGYGGYLMLNDQFQTYASSPSEQLPIGVGGEVSGAGTTKIKQFEWGDLILTEVEASTANLAHLGKDVERFAGLIGYEVLKNQIVEIDYDTRQLVLWNSSESFNAKYPNSNVSSVPFQMVAHLPVIESTFGPQKLRFGLDCGAQGNQLLTRLEKSMTPHLSNKRIEELGGADNNYKKVTKGQLKGITILDRKYDMDFVFGDLFGGHHEVTMMDGLLGFPFLSSQKTAINFIDNKLHFLD